MEEPPAPLACPAEDVFSMMRWVRDLVVSATDGGASDACWSTVEYNGDGWNLDTVVGGRSEKLLLHCSELADKRIGRELNFILHAMKYYDKEVGCAWNCANATKDMIHWTIVIRHEVMSDDVMTMRKGGMVWWFSSKILLII